MLKSGVKPKFSGFKKSATPFKKTSFVLQVNPFSLEKKTSLSFIEQRTKTIIENIKARNEEVEERIIKIEELKHKLDPEKTIHDCMEFLKACDTLQKICNIMYDHCRINYVGTQKGLDENPQIILLGKFEKNFVDLKIFTKNMNMYMTANAMFIMSWFNNVDNRIALDVAINLYSLYLDNYNKFIEKNKISIRLAEDLISQAEKLYGKEYLTSKYGDYQKSLEFLTQYSKICESQNAYLFFGNDKYQRGKNTSSYVEELNKNKDSLKGYEASTGMLKSA